MENARSSHIDYLKCFSIILVISGHCLNYYHKNYSSFGIVGQVVLVLIYGVHVPTFFCVSGYLLKRKGIKQYFKSKCSRVLIPFLFFSVLKVIYNNCVSDAFLHSTHGITRQLLDVLMYGDTYWFAYSILTCYILGALLWNLNNKQIWLVLLSVVAANTYIYIYDISVPNYFQFAKSLFHVPFYIVGYLVQRYRTIILPELNRKRIVLIPICIGTIALCLMLRYVVQIPPIGNIFPLAFVFAFALMYPVYIVCTMLPNRISCFTLIARYTYQVMLLDAFYKTLLFTVFRNVLSVPSVIAIIVLDLYLAVLTCEVVKSVPVVKTAFGLS